MPGKYQSALLKAYLHALPFGSILPTRPLVLFYGQKGSGKTILLKIIGRFLFGKSFNVFSLIKEKEDSFLSAVSRYPYLGYDNVDETIPWLNDALARISTGQKIVLRQLYTTNNSIAISPDTFIALSSRSPRFKRDDVVERMLIFPTKRIQKFIREHQLLKELDHHRNLIWTDYLYQLNKIIAGLKSPSVKEVENYRMADFADLGFRISRAFGEEDIFLQALKELDSYKAEFAVEEDPLIDALNTFLHQGAGHFGERLTASELFGYLRTILDQGGYGKDYPNPKALAHRLKNIGSELSQVLGIELEIIPRTHNNQNSYISIQPRGHAQVLCR